MEESGWLLGRKSRFMKVNGGMILKKVEVGWNIMIRVIMKVGLVRIGNMEKASGMIYRMALFGS